MFAKSNLTDLYGACDLVTERFSFPGGFSTTEPHGLVFRKKHMTFRALSPFHEDRIIIKTNFVAPNRSLLKFSHKTREK